jgi:hypothetical protein
MTRPLSPDFALDEVPRSSSDVAALAPPDTPTPVEPGGVTIEL